MIEDAKLLTPRDVAAMRAALAVYADESDWKEPNRRQLWWGGRFNGKPWSVAREALRES